MSTVTIRITQPVKVGSRWHDPGVGPYDTQLAAFLVNLGVAEYFEAKNNPETKTETGEPIQAKKSVSSSRPVLVSTRKTATKSKGKRK